MTVEELIAQLITLKLLGREVVITCEHDSAFLHPILMIQTRGNKVCIIPRESAP